MSFRVVKFIILIMLGAFSGILYYVFPLLEFNNDHWLTKTNPYQQDLNYLEDEFQPGFGCMVVLSFPNSYFSEENTRFFREFKQKIEQLPHVFTVNSPLDATVIIQSDNMLSIQTYDEAIQHQTISSIEHYKNLFTKSPYHHKLLSNNFQWVGLSVSISKKNDGQDLTRRVSTIETIQHQLSLLPQHVQGFVSGDAAIYYEMDLSTRRNLVKLLPLALGLLLIIAWVFLKQWRSVCIIIIPTLINLGLVPILIVMLGHTITIINVTLFILVLVITIADGIHMLNYWERYMLSGSNQPIADTIRATWLPCFITSITTAVGFGSFATSSIIPLTHYGIQSFIVMLFAYVVVMTFVPFFLRLFPPKVTSEKDTLLFPNVVSKLTKFVSKNTKAIAIGSILFTILYAQLLWKAKTETSFINVFFNRNHAVQKNVRLIDEHLTGSGRLDVLIKTSSPDSFKSIESFNALHDTIQQSLEIPLIKGSHDLIVPVRMIHGSFSDSSVSLPQSNEALEQALLFLEFSRGESKTDVLSNVVDFNYQNARVEYMTHQLPTYKIKTLIQTLQETFSGITFGEVSITGSQFLSYILGKYVLESQLITAIITLSFLWVLFVSLYGLKLGSIGMIPNVIPILITLSTLTLTKTPFDFATVLISSVTLGLCVDDTIHWLHYFKLCKKNGSTTPAITTSTVMFKPLFLTTVILGVGFGVLGMADLVILKKFGLFTMMSICLAFLADIVLLPAILRSTKLTQ